VGNLAKRGPLAIVWPPHQHSDKSLEMKVYWDKDFHIVKPETTGKQQSKNFRKRKNNNLAKIKKVLNTEI